MRHCRKMVRHCKALKGTRQGPTKLTFQLVNVEFGNRVPLRVRVRGHRLLQQQELFWDWSGRLYSAKGHLLFVMESEFFGEFVRFVFAAFETFHLKIIFWSFLRSFVLNFKVFFNWAILGLCLFYFWLFQTTPFLLTTSR